MRTSATTSSSRSTKRKLPAKNKKSEAKNATTFLSKQHREVEQLFKEIEGAGEKAFRKKDKLFNTLKEKVSMHAQLEEEFFYPAAREADEDLVLEAHEEHDNIKPMLEKFNGLDASDESFDAKITVLKELISHHVKEEENELFPKCKKALGQEKLIEIGEQMEEMMADMEQNAGQEDAAVKMTDANGDKANSSPSQESLNKPTRNREKTQTAELH